MTAPSAPTTEWTASAQTATGWGTLVSVIGPARASVRKGTAWSMTPVRPNHQSMTAVMSR